MSITALPRWFEPGLAWLYPHVCQFCESRRATAEEGFVCAKCWGQVRFIRPPFCERCGLPFEGAITTEFECSNCRELELHFTSARSAVTAKGIVLEAIHRYKYSRALWFEEFLADLLVRAATPVLRTERWDVIVPVPLHPTKLREREFNQAERLGAHLGRALAVPMQPHAVRRVQATQTQTRLSKTERAANVRRAFAPHPTAAVRGARVIVLDDVLTTGATTNACAGALRAAGAAEVCVWTVARGL